MTFPLVMQPAPQYTWPVHPLTPLVSKKVPLHPCVWEVHPEHRYLLDKDAYRYVGIGDGGPLWITVPRAIPPFSTPFTTSAGVAMLVIPWLGFEDSIRLSRAASLRSPFFRAAQKLVTTRKRCFAASAMPQVPEVFCRKCPRGTRASFRCDVCQSARCERCSRFVIARPIWMANNPPRAMVVCRQPSTGHVGYRKCGPSAIFPHGCVTGVRGIPFDGFISGAVI